MRFANIRCVSSDQRRLTVFQDRSCRMSISDGHVSPLGQIAIRSNRDLNHVRDSLQTLKDSIQAMRDMKPIRFEIPAT